MRPLSPTARAFLGRLLPPLLVGGASLALYAATAAPGLTWAHDGADGGDLITAAVTGGVPHPSGYPTWCLLGRLFALLPLGPIAHRLNLFSAVAAAASAVLVFWISLRLLERSPEQPTGHARLFAAGAALAYAVGPTLWSQATIAEVYALAALSFTVCIGLALAAGDQTPLQGGGESLWGALGLAMGLGLGSHLTLTLALPGIAVLLWPARTRRRLLALAAGLALGLGVYLYLPLAAARQPPVNWGDASRWSGFWWVVSGRLYQHYSLGLPLHHLPARVAAWAGLWAREFAWVGLAVAGLGVWSWWESGRRRLATATLLTLALYSAYAIAYNTTDSYVYLIPTYALTALWLAWGLRALGRGLLAQGPAQRGWRWVAVALALALPLYSAASRYAALDLSHDREAADWVAAVLAALPADALLVTGQDRHTFALDYACWVEGLCGDRIVVDGDLFAHDWYRAQLQRRYPGLDTNTDAGSLVQWLAEQGELRRVYLASPRPALESSFAVTARGSLWELGAQR